jgi:hypothetical protein
MTKRRNEYYRRPIDYVPVPWKPTDLAYLAGIIDGEGCFFINKLKTEGYHRGVLQVVNTDKTLIDWIDSVFPGTATGHNRYTSSRKFERIIYSWTSSGDRLLNICEQVLPYLVIKKKHCENMIEFRQTFLGRNSTAKVPEELIARRQVCLEVSRKLNTRFHLHPLKGNV